MGFPTEARLCRGGRARDARLDERQERRDRDVGRDREVDVGGRQALIVHAPAVVELVVERGEDDLGLYLVIAIGRLERAAEIDPVEAEDRIGLAQRGEGLGTRLVAGGRALQSVRGREAGAGLGVGQHRGIEGLGELARGLPRPLRCGSNGRPGSPAAAPC